MSPRHIALVLLVCLVWGGNFLTSAIALRELPSWLFTALRLALLALLLAAWLKPPAPGHWPRLIAVALCNGVLHFGLSFWALKLAGNLASPAIVMQSYIPMATLLAVVFLGERIGWISGAAIAISFAGVLVLGFDPVVMAAPESLGLMLASAFALACGTVLMRGLKGVDAMSSQAWTALLGVGPLLGVSLLVDGDPRPALQAASPAAWAGVAYSAIVASVLGHGLYYWLIQRHPVSQVMPYLLLTPVFAIALGIAFWGDRPGPRLLAGGAMVLGGVLVVALRAGARRRVPPEPSEI